VPFPTKLLNDNEEVIVDLRPHWSTMAKPVLAVIAAAAVTIGLAQVHIGHTSGVLGGLVLMAVGVGWFVRRYSWWTTTNFVVTTDRLVFRTGVVAKHGKEIPLERVNDIAFSQGFFERVIGMGNLSIESAGAQSRETFENIPHPSQVQNVIYRQMEAAAARHADRLAGRRELSVPEQLEKLDELRQRGVVTQAEFEAKKQQLLDRM
jgi:uncharacterized membrane protein YdbT with pleckstrin-like domain